MKKIFVFLPMILFLINVEVLTQTIQTKSFIVSFNSGGFLISRDHFSDTYNSDFGPTVGLGLGVTLSEKINLLVKATYFSKKGIPSISTFSMDSAGHSTIVTQKNGGSAVFRELLINAGLQYNIDIAEDIMLGTNGGLTFVYAKEVQNDKTGKNILTSNASGLWGFFIGASLEKRFGEGPFSLFMECQYNFNLIGFLGLIPGFGGTNISLGGRVYFAR
ncbi:MAG TPA: hypothetical protein VJ954_08520 [Ignavibacteriaceae bacterium]|nr:hypothetical protein [Ignavibacteriaceae bacterium]